MLLLAASVAAAPAAGATAAPRITYTSGSPQTIRVWVAARADRYEAKLEKALTASVSPPNLKVRFRCITPGCEFPAQDEPDSVARVDPRTYDVTGAKGVASIKLIVWTVTPENVIVTAEPSDRTAPQVRFLVNER